MLTETTGTTVNTYTYDHCNNRISHTLTVGGAVISAESYAYDQRCRLISVTGAQGMTLYGYDLSNARTAEYTLTADGASVIMSTGYTYAAPGLVSVCRGVNRNSEPMVHFEYTYYADGNLRTETDYVKNQITTYTYDNAGRLETEISPAGSYSYTYDAAGNRATMTENGTTTTYTYDKNNRLLRESKPGSTITYTYDANGNLLTGDGATYTYDARNRQVGYVKGSDFATYTYYPSGLRKTKTTALAISNYIWDGSNMICEYASSHDPSAAHRLSLRLGASCRRNSAQVESNRAQSTALLPFLPALGGETAIKQPTGLFYLCFPLIPNRWFGTIKEAAGANQTAAIEKEKDASCRKHPSLLWSE